MKDHPTQPFTPAGGASSQAATEARGMMQEARGESHEAAAEARDLAKRGASSLKSEAQRTARQAKDTGSRLLAKQKDAIAGKMHHYEDAIRAAAETLREEEENILVGPATEAAEQLGRACRYLDEREPADLLHDVESLARRRPELVFGSLFVAGFAASRFLKASSRRPRSRAAAATRPGRSAPGRARPVAEAPAEAAATEPEPGAFSPQSPTSRPSVQQPTQPDIP